jgi:hypothetical protein
VEVSSPLKPADYIERIRCLVAEGRDEEALGFAALHYVAMLPLLTLAELDRLNGTMEGAQAAVDMRQASIS